MASRKGTVGADEGKAPDVILDFEYEKGLLFIALENIGSAPAFKVSVKFDRKLTGVEGARELSALRLFKNFEFLAPKKRVRVFVDSFHAYAARGQPMVLNTTVRFRGKDGRRVLEKTRHDLSVYRDLPEVW